ncbi:M23 family metallopeptidase [Streptomyces tagetis]|uniref:Peptidoglycan DD-metalloendopeptidase family protein n=1 Tax=Streptomyces tagetis TaxID=2820809 RepID=A0A940XG95_9ACTN|nr:M23 family metallopeptidase [Streptomyces sp. RG38]MBQ0827791.1 peptidoglycan DD-metalloendopeptidase family protein [Streptomyces sp. RG38]
MPSPRPRSTAVPVVLCALAVLAARPSSSPDPGGPAEEVARLYEAAADAARQYEDGRRAAEEQRAKARRYEERLDRQRVRSAALHEDLGRLARAQYRGGGGLPLAAGMVLADDPDALMRGQRIAHRTDLAVDKAVTESRRAEERLGADQAEATAAWKALEKRNARLAELKKEIEADLRTARSRLEGRADASVTAGSGPGAARTGAPERRSGRTWVLPVESYELSASFGSGGARWAHRHTGQDFAVPVGTPVRAVGAGSVVAVSCGGPFGIQVVLRHADGYYTQYAHLASVAVDQGDRAGAGQRIGQSGSTGNSTGPHLHFEVRVTPEPGSAVDPVPWLSRRGVSV